jgi:hypothetical protein
MTKCQEVFAIAQRAHNLDCELYSAIYHHISQANDDNIQSILDVCVHITYEGLDKDYVALCVANNLIEFEYKCEA